jgi:hypothetical protein
MKLKYYMRGLGIGIILTTLIFTIRGNKEELSNDEIISRAMELGMVMQENQKANDVLSKMNQDVTMTPEPTAAAQPSLTPGPGATSEPSVTAGPTQTPEPTKIAEATEVPEISEAPKPTDIPIPTKSPETTVLPDEPKTTKEVNIVFTIQGGMSSGKVSKLLYQLGLVDDADKFNKYIVKVGKEDVIRVGTYKLRVGASYDDIVNTITK